MKIEAGKTYMDGEGTIVGPMERRSGPFYPFWGQTSTGYRLYSQGGFYYDEYTRCPEDLVAEYKDPKDREIVDWEWIDGEKRPVYADEDDAGTDSLPLLNIFKPIRTIHSKTPAKFLARADDGSYLFEVGGRYNIQRVDTDDVDGQFENVPEDALRAANETRAVVRLYKNAEGNKFFVWGSDARSQSALATCELTYSDEDGWQVRDLMTTKENEQ